MNFINDLFLLLEYFSEMGNIYHNINNMWYILYGLVRNVHVVIFI